MYVAVDQATCDRIQPGMSVDDVKAIFGRSPLTDTRDKEILEQFMQGKRNLIWGGPEGIIIVTFGKDGRVERTACHSDDRKVSATDWIRVRMGWWP
jgi:hypothetical protein